MFADGENLTFRYQEMLAAGKIPRQDTVHVVDTFVWNSRLTRSNYEALDNVIRVHYYTSATGDHDKIAALQEQLSQQKFVSPIGGSFHYGQVVPLVFKKLAQSKKTRNVDIQIVIDIMRYAFTDAIERIYLASGDGDYAPPYHGGNASRQAGWSFWRLVLDSTRFCAHWWIGCIYSMTNSSKMKAIDA
ncbi:MAG: NYN domain-containing protein [Candidatus Competibacteraceae bacterium]|nr:NYN domain-containing protein [Candidatus Competibacteraceae bacterium]